MTSYFQSAQNVAFNGTIVNAAGNYVQRGSAKDPLECLVQHITAGALHNSEERCDAPKCHAETRIAVQQEILSWIADGDTDDLPKQVLWMSGPAGTGKTAIAGSIAELCKERGLLAATFFFSSFSGSKDRSSKRRLITTIAYQLLQHACLEEVGKRILAAIERNPIIFEMRLKDQLEELILTPLREVHARCTDIAHWPRVIILDGLDEVEPDHQEAAASVSQQEKQKEAIHLEILAVLMDAARDPAFPFRIVVVSRPEKVIRGFFELEDARNVTREVFLDQKYHPDADIELFLRSKFAEIQRRYNLPSPWPAEDAIRTLVHNASGQFIYASTVIRFVADRTNLPQVQLDRVLSLGTPADEESNPFASLDALYTRILQSSPDPRLVIKWLRIIQRGQLFPALFWKQFLESAPGEAEYLLSNLSSLISIPTPADESTTQYVLYHKSMLEFFGRIPPSHSLYVPHHGQGGWSECADTCMVRALKNKGPQSLKNEAERAIFAARVCSPAVLNTPDLIPIESRPSWLASLRLRQFKWLTWATRPSLESDVLTCDAAWWVERIIDSMGLGWTDEVGRHGPNNRLSVLFWDVHCQCAWYRCLPVCIFWRAGIIRVCRARSWTVPSKWTLLRNRFIQWTMIRDSDGRPLLRLYPHGDDFLPLNWRKFVVSPSISREPAAPERALEPYQVSMRARAGAPMLPLS